MNTTCGGRGAFPTRPYASLLTMAMQHGRQDRLLGFVDWPSTKPAARCRAAMPTGPLWRVPVLIMAPATTAAMTAEGILSPEGSCKTFDADADGFVRAEAITSIYIKPLADALRTTTPFVLLSAARAPTPTGEAPAS